MDKLVVTPEAKQATAQFLYAIDLLLNECCADLTPEERDRFYLCIVGQIIGRQASACITTSDTPDEVRATFNDLLGRVSVLAESVRDAFIMVRTH